MAGEKSVEGKEAPLGKVWAATPRLPGGQRPQAEHTPGLVTGTAAPPTRPSETYGVLTRVQHAWWAEPWGRKFSSVPLAPSVQAAGNLSAGVVNSRFYNPDIQTGTVFSGSAWVTH